MNQKGYANIILIVLVVILAGVVGYLTLIKKPTSPVTTNQTPPANTPTQQTPPITSPEPTPKPVNWESLIPDIKITLQQAFPERIFRDEDIEILTKGDITGDGIPEALVQIYCGATTCELVLMRIENNKPVVSRFKQKDGEISYLAFSEGAGGAGRYGSGTKLIEDKNTIYFTHHFAYNESSDSCGAEAYQWNSQTKIFEFNVSLSNETGQNYCSKICSEIASEPDLTPYFQRICR